MKKERIIIIDVLRGFALLLIVLIHYVEHFDFFKDPDINFLFTKEFDHQLMETTFLLISGKAYSIFALLFGLSFFIQMDNNKQKGNDFRLKFLWRMAILFFIGFLHSLIYRGDILHIYAILSIVIILLYKVKTKYLWIIAGLLALQLPIIYNILQSFLDPGYEYVNPIKAYWQEGNEAYLNGDFKEVVQYNIWKGRISVYSWCYGNGRFLQLIALFIVGLILGRKKVFHNIESYKKKIIIILIASILLISALSFIKIELNSTELLKTQKYLIGIYLRSIINLVATSGFISLLTIIYLQAKNLYLFKLFAAYGKMSLSNYIFQSIFGVLFFYHFGFGMYRYLGSTWSIILGGLVFLVQAIISKNWNEKYYYGKLEWIWKCSTNLDFSIKLKR